MSYSIRPPNMMAQLGAGLGKGLSEQIPKEIERYRLAQGLQDFAQKNPNSPLLKQYADLLQIPGVKENPQLLQTFGELARYQQLSNAFGGGVQNQPEGMPTQQFNRSQLGQKGLSDEELRNIISQGQQQTPNIPKNAIGQPQIQEKGPLGEEMLPKAPWTPQQRNSTISNYIQQGFFPDQAQKLAADDEERFLKSPAAYEERFYKLQNKIEDARNELKRQLETKTQKKEDELYKDVIGENLINLERGMARDLRLHPEKTMEDVANDWSNRALNVAKAKTKFKELAHTTGIEALIPGSPRKVLNKLEDYSDIFAKSDNQEEYYNLLRKDMGTSPQGSAFIAFKPDQKTMSGLKSEMNKKLPSNLFASTEKAKNAANYLIKNLKPNDSVLSYAWALRNIDNRFDQKAFFDVIRKNKNILNDRQERELAEGESNMLPKWADLLVYPFFGGY